MKAIILAAGTGSRLTPLTDDTPKCMVEALGKPLLRWHLEALERNGIHDVIVVRGYLADKVQANGARFYENARYDETNMVYSLFCAKEELNDDLLVIYGDIIYTDSVIRKAIASPYDISVVIDEGWAALWSMRFENPLDDAETLKLDADGKIIEIGQKPSSMTEIEGQYIGMMKFSENGLAALKSLYEAADRSEDKGRSVFRGGKPLEQAYMTDALQALIDSGVDVRSEPINHGWFEIDSYSDYRLFHDLAAKGKLDQLIDIKE